MVVESYLDLYDLFVNNVAGTVWIFIALAMVAILYFSAKFRLPNMIMMMIMLLFCLVVGVLISNLLVAMAILLIGLFVGWVFNRIISRQF